MNFNESKTKENLARSFAGECQEGARYQFIAKQAVTDGFNYISDLFKTLAKQEMAHAKVFYQHLLDLSDGQLKNIEITAGYPFESYELKCSIPSAAVVEHSESKNIYPSFARIAKDEGFAEVANSFMLVAEVENCHYMQISEIAEKYKGNKLYKSAMKMKWKCTNCGHEGESREPWKMCPLCSFPQGYVLIPLSDEK